MDWGSRRKKGRQDPARAERILAMRQRPSYVSASKVC